MTKIITRDGDLTDELHEYIKQEFRGVTVEYIEVYYLDYAVDEKTYTIDKSRKEKVFTENQVEKNSKAFKSAYYKALNKK